MVQEVIIFLSDTCRSIISRGVCNEKNCERCKKRFCTVCAVVLPSEAIVQQHIKGQKHLKRVDERDNCPYPWFCSICDMSFKSPFEYPRHIESARHRQNLLRKSEDAESGLSTVQSGFGFSHCDICHKTFSKEKEERHQTTYIHRKRSRFMALQSVTGSGKHGVILKGDINFGKILPTSRNSSNFAIVSTTEENITMTRIRLASSAKANKRSAFSIQYPPLSRKLVTAIPETIVVTFDPRGVPGRYRDRVEIVLQSPNESFVITKSLQATIEDNEVGWDLLGHQADAGVGDAVTSRGRLEDID